MAPTRRFSHENVNYNNIISTVYSVYKYTHINTNIYYTDTELYVYNIMEMCPVGFTVVFIVCYNIFTNTYVIHYIYLHII